MAAQRTQLHSLPVDLINEEQIKWVKGQNTKKNNNNKKIEGDMKRYWY